MTARDPGGAESAGAGRRASRVALRRWLGVGTLAVGVVWLLSLAAPESARAIDPNPLHALGDVLDAGADAVTGGIGKLAVDGFGGIIKALFAWPAKMINRELLAWLVAVPDYAIHPASGGAGRDGSNLAQLGATTSAMAFAALGAVGTVSTIRYWAAGLTGSGGVEALEGLARTVGAALLIVLWPWLFRHAADLANAAGRGLLGSESVLDDTARLLAVAFLAGVAFNILSILVAIAAALLFLALLVSKIAVSAGTAVVFVGMPLALMLWPIPELAWIARAAMRMFATVLAIPLAWAVCFATFAAVGVDALALKGAGKAVDALIMPLVAVALLWLVVALPKTMARMALSGAAGGGGFASRTASRVAARRVDDGRDADRVDGERARRARAAGRRTRHRRCRRRSDGTPAGRACRGRAPRSAGRRPATAAAATGVGAATAAATRRLARSGDGPASRLAGARGPRRRRAGSRRPGVPVGGCATRRGTRSEHRVPAELTAAAQRSADTTRADVAGAMRALSPAARQGVIELMNSHGGQIRGQMAHQAARGELEASEREAFRTLAAASPEIRSHGINDFADDAGAEPLAAPSTSTAATDRGAGPAAPVVPSTRPTPRRPPGRAGVTAPARSRRRAAATAHPPTEARDERRLQASRRPSCASASCRSANGPGSSAVSCSRSCSRST